MLCWWDGKEAERDFAFLNIRCRTLLSHYSYHVVSIFFQFSCIWIIYSHPEKWYFSAFMIWLANDSVGIYTFCMTESSRKSLFKSASICGHVKSHLHKDHLSMFNLHSGMGDLENAYLVSGLDQHPPGIPLYLLFLFSDLLFSLMTDLHSFFPSSPSLWKYLSFVC